MTTPTGRAESLRAEEVAPGRLHASLPDAGAGLYAFVASTPLGTQRVLHLRRHRAETQTWGMNPAVDEWKSVGLVEDWREGRPITDGRTRREADPSLVALALVLFLAGVLADRAHLPRSGNGGRQR